MNALGGAPIAMARVANSKLGTVRSAYDLLKTPPTESTELGSFHISAQPLAIANNSSTIECSVPASDEYATDLSESFIVVDLKFTTKEENNLPAFDSEDLKVWVENNLAHTIFSRLNLSINDVDIFHTSAYSQMAYVATLLDETVDAKKGRLSAEGWYEDSVIGKDVDDYTATDDATVLERKRVLANSRRISLILKPFTPFRNSERRIPPRVSLKLSATRAPIKTIVMSTEEDADVEMHITRFEWFVRRCFVNPAVVRALNARLLEGTRYKLPMLRTRTRSFTIARGVQTHRQVLSEKNFLPIQLSVALVSQAGLNGHFQLSQFNYKHYGVSSYELLVDGTPVGKRLDCDFEHKNAIEAYVQTLSATGQSATRSGNGISYADFLGNKTVVAWVLNEPKNKEWGDYFHAKKKGTLELQLTFEHPTTETICAQVTDLREDICEIDLEGRVYTTEPAV